METELNKVQYLLQDGDSLAAQLKQLREDNETAERRFLMREKDFSEISKKDCETIAILRKQCDVAEVIQKAGQEQVAPWLHVPESEYFCLRLILGLCLHYHVSLHLNLRQRIQLYPFPFLSVHVSTLQSLWRHYGDLLCPSPFASHSPTLFFAISLSLHTAQNQGWVFDSEGIDPRTGCASGAVARNWTSLPGKSAPSCCLSPCAHQLLVRSIWLACSILSLPTSAFVLIGMSSVCDVRERAFALPRSAWSWQSSKATLVCWLWKWVRSDSMLSWIFSRYVVRELVGLRMK